MKKLLWTALVLLFVLIPLSASAETVNIDIGEAAWLDIMPDGYSTVYAALGSNDTATPAEHPFTGNYVISGESRVMDTAIDFYNFSGQPVVYNVTFKDLYIDAADWCTAIRIQGNADITLNITNIGDTSIETSAHHSAFQSDMSDEKLNINVMNTPGSKFFCNNRYNGQIDIPPVEPNNTYGGSGTITFKINGRQLSSGSDKTDVTHTVPEWIDAVWSPDVSDFMTEDSFLSNAHGVTCAFVCGCGCGQQLEATELETTLNNDGTGTYTARLAASNHWREATSSITYTFVKEPEMPATGDSAQLLMWSLLLAASVVALLTMRKTSRSH